MDVDQQIQYAIQLDLFLRFTDQEIEHIHIEMGSFLLKVETRNVMSEIIFYYFRFQWMEGIFQHSKVSKFC